MFADWNAPVSWYNMYGCVPQGTVAVQVSDPTAIDAFDIDIRLQTDTGQGLIWFYDNAWDQKPDNYGGRTHSGWSITAIYG